ncbi:hypothetical protein OQJ18_06945 [Fluoribacter dumoffii]|uniref:Uncharacterized protein n=1 Tax=Fluoribacter dumoffii TaxID=463 RepID=A0A377G7Y4_9GAMM|nr:hypothetical protein [Fluoribacter dumoffii]KTC89820.1 hypothetical protein Ldum_0888 [Fluoribacter dumoffii NY 23]MCW8385115.1 hypothetical protein [Fluoribacter dumoffii]MCW8418171.1 hypothetical protein [Fluoribacter dumoffii]MCW8453987.1 hypothetical protein [Fluoribacter dumoffii]MCW8461942.1 hypothetical protein [Fluoribacter dumoffii]
MLKHLVAATCFLSVCQSGFTHQLSYSDVQLCTNSYNHLWFVFESTKSAYRNDPSAQASIFTTEFSKVLASDFHFGLLNLPVPPDYTSTINLDVNGIPDLVNTAAFGIANWGEFHVANPFSVELTSEALLKKVYKMTTRDVDYTRNAADEGGCTVYISQKDVVCTVTKDSLNTKKAILNSIVDNVVTAYEIPAPQCALWTTPPITSYVN